MGGCTSRGLWFRGYAFTLLQLQVTTRTLRLSARRSTSAQPMAPVGSPSTASSAPTELSSTRTTSSATGGSTSTAPPPRSSTPSTTRSQQQIPAPEKHPEVLPKAAMPPHRPKHLARPRLLATLQRLQGRRLLMLGPALPRCTLRLGRGGEGRSQERGDGKGNGKEGEEDRGSKPSDEAEMKKYLF